MSVDPERQFFSSYTGFANNPILYNDPNGEEIYIYYVTAGTFDLWGHNAIGAYCTDMVRNIIFESYVDNGYSEEEASKIVNKILPNTVPHGTPTDPDVLKELGYSGMTIFYQVDGEDLVTVEETKFRKDG